MQGVTKVRPAPGVLSSFDERGCAVVDTLHDTWLYLTGEEAWVWQSVEITGTTGHLEGGCDMETLHYFVEAGLMILEEEDASVPFTYLDPDVYEYEHVDRRHPLRPDRVGSAALQRSWWQAARLDRRPLHRIVQRVRAVHAEGHPYLDGPSLHCFHQDVIETVPWWNVRAGLYSQRTVALATCMAARHAKARVDLAFGMSHAERSPAWWCSVPQGTAGRPEETLMVATV